MADAMEREAAARYGALGRSMRRVSHDAVAQVFEDLAAEEQHHVDQVERLAQQVLQRLPHAPAAGWQLPETFSPDDETVAADLTPYRALSIAVQNEERAFAFWSYVAAEAADPKVRAQAEAMARQELRHAAKLRHERRRAFHAQRAAGGVGPAQTPVPESAAAARDEAQRLESQAAAFLDAAAGRLDRMKDAASAKLLRTIAGEIRSAWPAGSAAQAPSPLIDRAVEAFGAAPGSAALLFEAAGVIERLALTYLEWLDARAEPALTEALEPLEQAAAGWLARLHARLAAVAPELKDVTVAGKAAS